MDHIVSVKYLNRLAHTVQDVLTEALSELLAIARLDEVLDGAAVNGFDYDEVILLVLEGLNKINMVLICDASLSHQVVDKLLLVCSGAVFLADVLHDESLVVFFAEHEVLCLLPLRDLVVF